LSAEKKQPTHSSVRSFRLENSNIELLEREAQARNVSSNAIVNELIGKGLRKERGMRGVKYTYLTAYTVRLLTERLTPEEILEIADKAAKDQLHRNILWQQGGSHSARAILEAIKLYWECDESEIEGRKILIVELFCGRNFSFYFGETFKLNFASMGASVNYTYDDDATIFEFDEKATQMLSES